ncbi:MAG TPA: hypothetical protein VFV52_05580 [Bacilli bacterium]|nr:hypothetical protein [Bacilli bacterium]
MRKRWWGVGLLVVTMATAGVSKVGATGGEEGNLVANTAHTQITAKTDVDKQAYANGVFALPSDISVAPLVLQVANSEPFADWKQGQASYVRDLYDPHGNLQARLWQVNEGSADGAYLGYLVSTPDGQGVYEYSRHALPTLPDAFAEQALEEGYIYAGPLLHLVYLKQEGRLELFNLMTGEMLPYGELINRVPAGALGFEDYAGQGVTHRTFTSSVDAEADALYATGRYGQDKLKGAKSSLSLTQFANKAGQDAVSKPAYAVYDAISNKVYVPLAITDLLQQGETAFVGLQDPFLGGESVYVTAQYNIPVY